MFVIDKIPSIHVCVVEFCGHKKIRSSIPTAGSTGSVIYQSFLNHRTDNLQSHIFFLNFASMKFLFFFQFSLDSSSSHRITEVDYQLIRWVTAEESHLFGSKFIFEIPIWMVWVFYLFLIWCNCLHLLVFIHFFHDVYWKFVHHWIPILHLHEIFPILWNYFNSSSRITIFLMSIFYHQ